jgi:hypothetical protein
MCRCGTKQGLPFQVGQRQAAVWLGTTGVAEESEALSTQSRTAPAGDQKSRLYDLTPNSWDGSVTSSPLAIRMRTRSGIHHCTLPNREVE